MRKLLSLITGFALIILFSSWGYFAHYRINKLAVYTLPKPMAAFYKANLGFIVEHAITPDKRRYVDSAEIPRHFFNADRYGKNPFNKIPRKWKDFEKKYGRDTMLKHGILPWTIQQNYYWLVKAFKEHDTLSILRTSANLAHYVADAHVPLHLALNHDGQLTGQEGIHALWESRLPELFGGSYKLLPAKARYINNPLTEAFKYAAHHLAVLIAHYACSASSTKLSRKQRCIPLRSGATEKLKYIQLNTAVPTTICLRG